MLFSFFQDKADAKTIFSKELISYVRLEKKNNKTTANKQNRRKFDYLCGLIIRIKMVWLETQTSLSQATVIHNSMYSIWIFFVFFFRSRDVTRLFSSWRETWTPAESSSRTRSKRWIEFYDAIFILSVGTWAPFIIWEMLYYLTDVIIFKLSFIRFSLAERKTRG